MKEILLLIHPALGTFGVIAAGWVIVETMNASQQNLNRIKIAALLVAVFIVLTWIFGGTLYLNYYAPDKAIILKGPWPFAHNFFMESKEHLFFLTLILSLFLPIVTRVKDILTNKETRKLIIVIAALIMISGIVLDAAGAIISLGIREGLIQNGIK